MPAHGWIKNLQGNGPGLNSSTSTSSGGNSGYSSNSAPSNNNSNNNNSKKNNNKNDNTKEIQEEIKTWLNRLFDWIEKKLSRIQEITDLNEKKASNALTATRANAYLDENAEKVRATLAVGEDGRNDFERIIDTTYDKAEQILRQQLKDPKKYGSGSSSSSSSSSKSESSDDEDTSDSKSSKSKASSSKKSSGKSEDSSSSSKSKSSSSSSDDGKTITGEKQKTKVTEQDVQDIIDGVRDGTIDLDQYDSNIQSIISEYDEWISKARSLESTLEDQKQKLYEINKAKLDNIRNEFDNIRKVIDADTNLYKAKASNAKNAAEANGYLDHAISNVQRQLAPDASGQNMFERNASKLATNIVSMMQDDRSYFTGTNTNVKTSDSSSNKGSKSNKKSGKKNAKGNKKNAKGNKKNAKKPSDQKKDTKTLPASDDEETTTDGTNAQDSAETPKKDKKDKKDKKGKGKNGTNKKGDKNQKKDTKKGSKADKSFSSKSAPKSEADKLNEKPIMSDEMFDDIADRIKNGTFNILDYDDEVQGAIANRYGDYLVAQKEWLQSAEDTKAELHDLNKQKLDNITGEYDALLSLSQELVNSAQSYASIVKILNGGQGLDINYIFEKGNYGDPVQKEKYRNSLKAVQGALQGVSAAAGAAAGALASSIDTTTMTDAEIAETQAKIASYNSTSQSAQAQILETQQQIDNIELEHLQEIQREWGARAGILQSQQAISDAIIETLKTQGAVLELGQITYDNDIRMQLNDKIIDQAGVIEHLKKEYEMFEEQMKNVAAVMDGEESTNYKEQLAVLNGIEQQIIEAENTMTQLEQELNHTFVEHFDAMTAAFDRQRSVIESQGNIAGSMAELYKTLGRYTYESGLDESTYMGNVAENLLQQQQRDREIADRYASHIEKAAAEFADIAVRYDENSQDYQTAEQKFYDTVSAANEAQRKVIEDQLAIDELELTRLEAIKKKYDSYASLNDAVTAASKATVDLFKTLGSAVNSPEMRRELTRQFERQQNTTAIRQGEYNTYAAQMSRIEKVFGTNSNQYRETQAQLANLGQELAESRNAEVQLKQAIKEMNFTFAQYVIENLKAFVSKLSALAQLTEKRGTNPARGYLLNEGLYSDQIKYNNELVTRYNNLRQDRISQIEGELKAGTLQYGSERYQELYKSVVDAENSIISLLSSNEDLAKSIRNLRWKPYEDLKRNLDNIISDYKHLLGLIRQEEMINQQTGEITERGYAYIALLGGDIDKQSAKLAAAKAAVNKLNDEYKRGTINLETYNSEIDANIKLVQDATAAIYDDQQALANLKVTQWQKESDVLNEVIQKRKQALESKKAYYDYDKNLRKQNKDIAQLQASISALAGVTDQSSQAKRARLEAELAERQQELRDTREQHQFDLQSQGYDQLSEDMRVSLEDATKLITGNQEALQYTALQMLEQLKLNDINEVGIVNDLINNTGTMVHTATMSAFTNTLNAPDGLVSQASRVYETLNTKSDEIGTILADNRTALDTWLNTVYTSSEANAANTVNSINASGVAVNNQIKTIYDQLKVDQNNRLSKITAKADDIYNKSAQLINSIDAGAPKVSDIREINNYINGEGGKIASLGPKIQYTTAAVQNVGTSVNLIGNKLDTANSLLASFIKAAGQKKEAEAAAAAAKKAADDAAKKAAADAQKKKIEDAIRAQMNSYVNDMKKKLGISDSATKQYEQVRDRAKKLDEMIRNYDSKQTNSAKRIGVYMSNYSNLSDYLNALGRMSPGAIADAQVRSQFEYLTKDLNVNEIRRYEQDLGKINEGVAALQNIFDGVIAKVWTGEIKDATAGIDSIKKQIQSLLYGDVRGNGGLLRSNGTTVYQFYDIHEDSKDDKKTNYYQGYTTSPYMTGAYASGTRRVSHSELAWTQEDGPELILRPSDGAVLTPLKMNDAVVPANFTDNLFKWGAINPDSFAVNPFMGKWGETAGGSDATDVYSNTNNQAVTLNIGSMFQIEGNVDSGVVDRLEDIAKQLTSNKDFQKNVINFVTKNYVKESRKQGFR